MAASRLKRVVRLQVHRFLYRAKCDQCERPIVAGELIPIGMKDCPERDRFIDSFRTGSMQFLSSGHDPLCEHCALDEMLDALLPDDPR